jgi:hypothetical protein
MNTKPDLSVLLSAVILMIGLLGMPAVYNFTNTKQMDNPSPRWSVVSVNNPSLRNPPHAILLNNQTGQVRYLSNGLVGPDDESRESHTAVFMSSPKTPHP